MKKFLFSSAIGLASAIAVASTAFAGPTLTLGYAVDGGTVTTLGSGQGNISFSAPAGDQLVQATVTGQTEFGQFVNFDLGINGGSSVTSPITVYLTESDLTGQQIESISAELTNNLTSSPAASALEYTLYGSTANDLFTGTVLASSTVSNVGVVNLYDGSFDSGTGLYSITQAITISPNAAGGYTNVSLDGAVNVPEPGSLALLGTGLIALGMLVRKRQKRA
jgi:hypothetical protein